MLQIAASSSFPYCLQRKKESILSYPYGCVIPLNLTGTKEKMNAKEDG